MKYGTGFLIEQLNGFYVNFYKKNNKWIVSSEEGVNYLWTNEELKKYVKIFSLPTKKIYL
tara:strand:+ start:353 stop:532 length:180 start_codon:yes stop_codon:yes gene_type:complete